MILLRVGYLQGERKEGRKEGEGGLGGRLWVELLHFGFGFDFD